MTLREQSYCKESYLMLLSARHGESGDRGVHTSCAQRSHLRFQAMAGHGQVPLFRAGHRKRMCSNGSNGLLWHRHHTSHLNHMRLKHVSRHVKTMHNQINPVRLQEFLNLNTWTSKALAKKEILNLAHQLAWKFSCFYLSTTTTTTSTAAAAAITATMMLRARTRTTKGFLHLLESKCQTAIQKMQNLQSMVCRTLSANCLSFVCLPGKDLIEYCSTTVKIRCVCVCALWSSTQEFSVGTIQPQTQYFDFPEVHDGTTGCCSMFRMIANEVPSLYQILHSLHL
jgi:hypothetical protein